jgi:hypothetical protein
MDAEMGFPGLVRDFQKRLRLEMQALLISTSIRPNSRTSPIEADEYFHRKPQRLTSDQLRPIAVGDADDQIFRGGTGCGRDYRRNLTARGRFFRPRR